MFKAKLTFAIVTTVLCLGFTHATFAAGCGCNAKKTPQYPPQGQPQQMAPQGQMPQNQPQNQPQYQPQQPPQAAPQQPSQEMMRPQAAINAPATEVAPPEEIAAVASQQQGMPQTAQPQYGASPSQQGMNPQPSSQIMWLTDFNEAVSQAKQGNKYIVLFFTGSDWCGWCKKIDAEVFSSPDFARAVGNRFVFVELDFPMNKVQTPELTQQNNQLKQKYGVTGYPTVVILDSNQNFIAETGYRPGGGKAYADYLLSLLNK